MKVYLKPLGREYAADLHAASQVEEIRFLTNKQANFSLEQIQAHLKNIREDETRPIIANSSGTGPLCHGVPAATP